MFIKCSIGVKKNKENTRFIIFFPSLTICMLERKKKKMLRCIYDDFFLHHPFWRESHVSFKRFYFLPHTLTHGFENGLSLKKKTIKIPFWRATSSQDFSLGVGGAVENDACQDLSFRSKIYHLHVQRSKSKAGRNLG